MRLGLTLETVTVVSFDVNELAAPQSLWCARKSSTSVESSARAVRHTGSSCAHPASHRLRMEGALRETHCHCTHGTEDGLGYSLE